MPASFSDRYIFRAWFFSLALLYVQHFTSKAYSYFKFFVMSDTSSLVNEVTERNKRRSPDSLGDCARNDYIRWPNNWFCRVGEFQDLMMCVHVFWTVCYTGRLTRQSSKLADECIGLADTLDFSGTYIGMKPVCKTPYLANRPTDRPIGWPVY